MSDEPPGLNSPRSKARFRSMYDDPGFRRPTSRPLSAEAPAGKVPEDTAPPTEADASEMGSVPPAIAAAAPTPEENELLPNFRLTKVYEEPARRSNPLTDWRWLLLTALLAVLGAGGGYAFARLNASVPPQAGSETTAGQPVKLRADPLSEPVEAQADNAFAAIKKGQYQEAHDRFLALREQHPEWWPMDIEAARASLYQRNPLEAQQALHDVPAPQGSAEVDFVLGLLHLSNQELDLAAPCFASAAARNPARPDFYYFWGDTLRRNGKNLEAARKFRSALLRNQYEYAEGLYQLKLWLAQIQSDQEETSGANKDIDKALALPRVPYEVLFAAAARELKAKRYKEAGEFITRARMITEPAVFRVIMQDPSFAEEDSRPELAPFYKE